MRLQAGFLRAGKELEAVGNRDCLRYIEMQKGSSVGELIPWPCEIQRFRNYDVQGYRQLCVKVDFLNSEAGGMNLQGIGLGYSLLDIMSGSGSQKGTLSLETSLP